MRAGNRNPPLAGIEDASRAGEVEILVTPADIELVRGAVGKISVPAWTEVCDKSNPGCSQKWMTQVAPVIGVK